MQTLNVTEAKAQFSEVVERVVGGENIIVTRRGKPVVKISRYEPAKVRQRTGHFRGQIKFSDDFDEWSDKEVRALG